MIQFVRRYYQARRGFVWAVVGCLVIQVLVPGCAKASDADPAKEKSSPTRTYWTPQRMREQWAKVHAALKQRTAQQLQRQLDDFPAINYELQKLVNDRDSFAAAAFVRDQVYRRDSIASELNRVLQEPPDKYSDGAIKAIFYENLELLSFPDQPLTASWNDLFGYNGPVERYEDGRIWGLTMFAMTGNIERADGLIRFGADLNIIIEPHGSPPLYDALFGGHLDVAKLLILAGADVNLTSRQRGSLKSCGN